MLKYNKLNVPAMYRSRPVQKAAMGLLVLLTITQVIHSNPTIGKSNVKHSTNHLHVDNL